MTHTELNALPHRTTAELDAIPSIRLNCLNGMGKHRVFDAVETPEGWEACSRNPRTGDFNPRQLFARANYSL